MNTVDKLTMLDAMDSVPFDGTVDVQAIFDHVLSRIEGDERVVFVGGPRSGKSTLTATAAERFKMKPRHADSLIGQFDWSAHSERVSEWIGEPGRWITEGVSTARAIRKWLLANPGPVPFSVVYMGRAIQIRSEGQVAMANGVDTVWNEVLPELEARGAKVVLT
jgi:hypothetical protein